VLCLHSQAAEPIEQIWQLLYHFFVLVPLCEKPILWSTAFWEREILAGTLFIGSFDLLVCKICTHLHANFWQKFSGAKPQSPRLRISLLGMSYTRPSPDLFLLLTYPRTGLPLGPIPVHFSDAVSTSMLAIVAVFRRIGGSAIDCIIPGDRR